MLWRRRATTHIPKLQITPGSYTQHPSKIASTFLDYYSGLYNISEPLFAEALACKQSRIQDYLEVVGVPSLSAREAKGLKRPISESELALTLKNLPKGKSQGPMDSRMHIILNLGLYSDVYVF